MVSVCFGFNNFYRYELDVGGLRPSAFFVFFPQFGTLIFATINFLLPNWHRSFQFIDSKLDGFETLLTMRRTDCDDNAALFDCHCAQAMIQCDVLYFGPFFADIVTDLAQLLLGHFVVSFIFQRYNLRKLRTCIKMP